MIIYSIYYAEKLQLLAIDTGILSGFSFQSGFKMLRYKSALQVSRCHFILAKLPFSASTFVSPRESNGVLHTDDFELLSDGKIMFEFQHDFMID